MERRAVDDARLVAEAIRARDRARAPYSGFPVGAAALDDSGKIHLGANIENAAYPAGICAERVALFSAVMNGAERIVALAVVAASPGPVRPCGACRQVIAELAPSARIVMANLDGAIDSATVDELLPFRFELFPRSPFPPTQ